MKLFNKLFLIPFLALICICFFATGEVEGPDLSAYPVKKLRVPIELYESGKEKVQMFADGARVNRKDETQLVGVRVEFYTLDGEVEASVYAANCVYHSRIKAVMSQDIVRIEKTGIVISGVGFEWKSADEVFEIVSNANVEIAGKLDDGAGISPPTVITSDSLVFDYYRDLAFFDGNVRAKDSQVEITSDKLVVMFEGTNSIKTATADGNVHAVAVDADATCKKALFIAEESKIIMTGDASVVTSRGIVTGEKIVVWVNERRITCEPAHLFVPDKPKEEVVELEMDAEPIR